MFGSTALETFIGLVTVYVLFSAIVSSLREAIEWFVQDRSKTLRAVLKTAEPPGSTPVEPRYLAVARFANQAEAPATLPKANATEPPPAIDPIVQQADAYYKQITQLYLFICAIIVVVFCNLDTLVMIRHFSTSDAARKAIVEASLKAIEPPKPDPATPKPDPVQQLKQDLDRANALNLPIGWEREAETLAKWEWFSKDAYFGWTFSKFGGLLLSIMSLSAGGQFWFDLLKKLVSLRSVVDPQAPPKDPGKARQ